MSAEVVRLEGYLTQKPFSIIVNGDLMTDELGRVLRFPSVAEAKAFLDKTGYNGSIPNHDKTDRSV